jgi:threonine/homoserine/homoserine lactone efflux protein
MVTEVLTALGIGIALAGAPGPVQAVLLAEAVRGGVGRGLRALVGASLTFGLLLLCVALGVSVVIPDGPVLSALRVAGGGLLIWLAVEALRFGGHAAPTRRSGTTLPAAARGSLAVLLNPGAWLFLGAVASPALAPG